MAIAKRDIVAQQDYSRTIEKTEGGNRGVNQISAIKSFICHFHRKIFIVVTVLEQALGKVIIIVNILIL